MHFLRNICFGVMIIPDDVIAYWFTPRGKPDDVIREENWFESRGHSRLSHSNYVKSNKRPGIFSQAINRCNFPSRWVHMQKKR